MATITHPEVQITVPADSDPVPITNRGRRPALIPYTEELASLFASPNFSPTTQINSMLGIDNSAGKSPLFVLPPVAPGGENQSIMLLPSTTWRGPEPEDEPEGFEWDSDDSGDESSVRQNKEIQKAELHMKQKKVSGAFAGYTDDIEINENAIKDIEGDVFRWVNEPHDGASATLRRSENRQMNKNKLQLPHDWMGQLKLESKNEVLTWTAPTSPMSGNFGVDLEMQRKRLEAVGVFAIDDILQ